MASPPIYNPIIPYIGLIDGGLHPGKIIRIQGSVHPTANRFAINLQCGPNMSPRDDIALHVSPRFIENHITRTSLQGMCWGIEENHGHMPLARGQGFEIIILCDPSHYKIAVNGHHFTEFGHRIPFQRVTYLAIDGDVTVSLIQYEGGCSIPGPGSGFVPPPPLAPVHPPPLPTGVPYPPNPMMPGSYGPPHGPGGHPYPPPAPGYPGGPYTKKQLKAQKKAHKKALKYGLPIAGAGLGAYALHKGFHHHHHRHGSSSSSSSSSSEEE